MFFLLTYRDYIEGLVSFEEISLRCLVISDFHKMTYVKRIYMQEVDIMGKKMKYVFVLSIMAAVSMCVCTSCVKQVTDADAETLSGKEAENDTR